MYFIEIIVKQLSCDSCRTCPDMLKWQWVVEKHLSLNFGTYKVYALSRLHRGISLALLGTSFTITLYLSHSQKCNACWEIPSLPGDDVRFLWKSPPAKVSNILRMRAGSWAPGSLCEQELLINHTKRLESLDHCHCKHNSADPSSDPTIFHIYFVSVWRLFQQFFWEVEITVSLQGLQKSSAEVV